MSVTVFAPATIANLGVGFDLLGAAIVPVDGSLLGDKVSVEPGDNGIEIVGTGDYRHCLPQNPHDNVVYHCALKFLQQFSLQQSGLRLTLDKGLPVGSGLGSSASSIVAAVCALNEYFGGGLTNEAMLRLMGEIEGQVSGSIHYDNVAPAFLGGLQLMVQANDRLCESLPHFEHWFWIIAYPGTSLSTAQMRALLPDRYDRGDVIKFGRYLSGFVHGLYRRDQKLALSMINDVVAEPYRRSHIPGYNQAKAAVKELEAVACNISGSGPTLFAIAEELRVARAVEEWLLGNYVTEPGGFVKVCRIDKSGARLINGASE